MAYSGQSAARCSRAGIRPGHKPVLEYAIPWIGRPGQAAVGGSNERSYSRSVVGKGISARGNSRSKGQGELEKKKCSMAGTHIFSKKMVGDKTRKLFRDQNVNCIQFRTEKFNLHSDGQW